MIPVAASLAVLATLSVTPQATVPWPSAHDFEGTVSASLVETRGDTLVLEYAVENDPNSDQSIETVVVRYAGIATHVRSPAPGWVASLGEVQDSLAASWVGLGTSPDVLPGGRLAGFRLEGVGALDIVGFYLQADYAIPVYNDSLPDRVDEPPPLWSNSVSGLTVGLGMPPTDASPSALVDRLVNLTDQSCGMGWISEPGICNSLDAKQRAAARSVDNDDLPTACNQLSALINEVLALEEGKISAEARALVVNGATLAISSFCD